MIHSTKLATSLNRVLGSEYTTQLDFELDRLYKSFLVSIEKSI